MYQRHFGFRERPFRLVPDPAYLFMGHSHREAMAHLAYAVQSGDGFAAVIGEVGTGKTTLCRSFLEELEEGVASAYIFNPPADPVELMRAVNRDLGLPASGDRLQELVEDLNRFLMHEKAEGRTALLVIDEAQRLSRPVLEQVRLLSNLETTRSKLLIIVLVGQPELETTLADHGLRQLRQRITTSCRLTPMTPVETGAYIRHRLAVAAEGVPVVFSPAAVRVIFAFSKGIPRLINIACDRALVVAYAADTRQLDRRLAGRAVKELKSDAPARHFPRRLTPVLLATLLVAVAALGLNLKATQQNGPETRLAAMAPQPTAPALAVRPEPEERVDADPAESWVMDRSRALSILLDLWGLSLPALDTSPMDDETFFARHAQSLGLELYPVSDRLDLVVSLNLPALLFFDDPQGARIGYGVLAAVQENHYWLAGDRGIRHPLTRAELEALWSGKTFVLWRNFYSLARQIPGRASSETILNLKSMLRDLGFPGIETGPEFDDATRRAVIDFQTRLGLPADGLVGPQTKIALYNTRPELTIPMLRPLAPVQRTAPTPSQERL
jgi:general secretion pathway protein A